MGNGLDHVYERIAYQQAALPVMYGDDGSKSHRSVLHLTCPELLAILSAETWPTA